MSASALVTEWRDVTPWYHHRRDGNPARPGVYATRNIGSDGDVADRVFYRHWNGNHWGYAGFTPHGALVNGYRYGNQLVMWRGLAKEPTQ